MELNKRTVFLGTVLLTLCLGSYILSRVSWMKKASDLFTETFTKASSDAVQHHRNKTDGRHLHLAGDHHLQRSKKKKEQMTASSPRLDGGTSSVEFVRVAEDELALRLRILKDSRAPSAVGVGGVASNVTVTFNTLGMGRRRGADVILKLLHSGKLDFSAAARYPVADEHWTSMDREILADKPVTDLTTVGSPKTSLLELVGLRKGAEVRVGDTVKVRVIIRDVQGRPVTRGGHHVRVWMVGRENRRSAAVDVTDLRNGTFLASVPVLWPGNIEVRAALQRPREFHRVVLSLLNRVKMLVPMMACFVSGKKEEVTLCSFSPVLPGYHEVCNLTTLNNGLPWYCGRPSTPGLKCRHWTFSNNADYSHYYPITEAERAIISPYRSKRTIFDTHLQQIIPLTAVQDPVKRDQAGGVCRRLKPRETWEDHSPRGYWEGNTWHGLNGGCQLPQFNHSVVLDCLQDTHFIAFGDSNARFVVQQGMQPYTQCRQEKKAISYHCPEHKLQLSWYPHAFPYYDGVNTWATVRRHHSPRSVLDALPATGNYVIMIHLYMHFALQHAHIYAQQVRDTARGVRDLLKRNPRVKVFVRGPHAVDRYPISVLSDVHASRCLRSLQQEFQDLKDRVVFLNMMDMTIANENCDIHPNEHVVRTIIEMIMSHVCLK